MKSAQEAPSGALQTNRPQSSDQILPLVYSELRKLAAIRIAQEATGNTLQPTALVHEAWLRLGANSNPVWDNPRHFFMAAAEAMRRILIERARRRKRLARGGDRPGKANLAKISIEPRNGNWIGHGVTKPTEREFKSEASPPRRGGTAG